MQATISTGIHQRPQIPPSQRDFEIYRFVKIERHSTRQAAKEFNLSQTRVRQVIEGIIEFLVESVPLDDEGKRVDRLQVAEQLAREQLDFLYGQAITWWHQSVHGFHSGQALPKPAYLALAARITMCMTRVPVHKSPGWEEEESDELAGDLERTRAGETPTLRRERPPVEDCSGSAVSRADGAAIDQPAVAESDLCETPYDLVERIKSQTRRDFLRPAQPLATEDREPLVGGVSESTGSAPQPTAGRPLNRKERRARQRRLERALAKR